MNPEKTKKKEVVEEPKITFRDYVPEPKKVEFPAWSVNKAKVTEVMKIMTRVAQRQSVLRNFSNMTYVNRAELGEVAFKKFSLKKQLKGELLDLMGVDCCGQAQIYIHMLNQESEECASHAGVLVARKDTVPDGIHYDHGIPAIKCKVTDDGNKIVLLLVDIGQFNAQCVGVYDGGGIVESSSKKYRMELTGNKLKNHFLQKDVWKVLFQYDIDHHITNSLNITSKKLIIWKSSKIIQMRFMSGDTFVFWVADLKKKSIVHSITVGNDLSILSPKNEKLWTHEEMCDNINAFLEGKDLSSTAIGILFDYIKRCEGVVMLKEVLNLTKTLPAAVALQKIYPEK